METTEITNSQPNFQIWRAGTESANGKVPASMLAVYHGTDFNDAVKSYVNTLPPMKKPFWKFDESSQLWSFAGVSVHDNERDALRHSP